jgi:hypothetical protein
MGHPWKKARPVHTHATTRTSYSLRPKGHLFVDGGSRSYRSWVRDRLRLTTSQPTSVSLSWIHPNNSIISEEETHGLMHACSLRVSQTDGWTCLPFATHLGTSLLMCNAHKGFGLWWPMGTRCCTVPVQSIGVYSNVTWSGGQRWGTCRTGEVSI